MVFDWLKLKKSRNPASNYKNKIIRSIIVSSYVKKKINVLVMMLATVLLRTCVCSLFCFVISYNIYIDFFLHSFISIILVLNSEWIYDIVEGKNHIFYSITRYAINNYTPVNWRRWKRNVILCIAMYFIVLLLIFDVDSNILIMYIVQYILTYFIIDLIEHNKLDNIIKNIRDKPKQKLFNDIDIIEDHYAFQSPVKLTPKSKKYIVIDHKEQLQKTKQDKLGQDKLGQDKPGQDKTGQDKPGQDK